MIRICFAFAIALSLAVHPAIAQEKLERFAPDQSVLFSPPPDGAIVLFDGRTNLFLSKNGKPANWPIVDGCLVSSSDGSNTNHVVSQWHFQDADIHVEFATDPKSEGNSGIYIHGNYELQIYDSFGAATLSDHDEGAIYGFHKPTVNASRKTGEWQVYDIRFLAPRRNEIGKITKSGSITAWLNGQLVQDNSRFEEPRSVYHPFRYGSTAYLDGISHRQQGTRIAPVFLQDHGSPTRFRNVWLKPLDSQAIRYEDRP